MAEQTSLVLSVQLQVWRGACMLGFMRGVLINRLLGSRVTPQPTYPHAPCLTTLTLPRLPMPGPGPQDAQGFLVAEDGSFTLQHVHAGQLQEAALNVRGGVLTLHLPVGSGPMWLSAPAAPGAAAGDGDDVDGHGPATVGRLLVLRPTSDNFKHAQPLCVYLHVRPGR